jgi:hypothetical protein
MSYQANNLDAPPIYDPIAGDKNLSPVWQAWFATFVQSLQDYVSISGVVMPTVQNIAARDAISNPNFGTVVYVLDQDKLYVYLQAGWKSINVT